MSGVELGAALFGSSGGALAFDAATSTFVTTAATSGAFGSAGAFALAPTLSTVGNVLTAGSILGQGSMQSEAAKANSRSGYASALAEEDATARNAFSLERSNRIEAQQLADQQQRAKSKRAVGWGASGVTMAGSPIQVESGASYTDAMILEQTKQTGKLAVDNIYYGGAVRASKLRSQAALDSYMGKSYLTGSALTAGGSLLTRGASIYGR